MLCYDPKAMFFYKILLVTWSVSNGQHYPYKRGCRYIVHNNARLSVCTACALRAYCARRG